MSSPGQVEELALDPQACASSIVTGRGTLDTEARALESLGGER